ncbi:MAG: hypothetical protein U1E61_18855 [Bradyrhizobium sp.]
MMISVTDAAQCNCNDIAGQNDGDNQTGCRDHARNNNETLAATRVLSRLFASNPVLPANSFQPAKVLLEIDGNGKDTHREGDD